MNNPASRLHDILNKARDKKLRGEHMMKAWRSVLSLPEEMDELMVMSKVGKVFVLPSTIEVLIKRFPDLDADLYLGWRKDLANAFKRVNMNTGFAEFSDRLSDSMLVNIRFCAHELNKRMPEKDVSEEELSALKEMAWSLYEEIIASDIPPHISQYLIDHLYLIISAIEDFTITGSIALERSINTVVGTVVTNRTIACEVRDSNFGARFWEIVGKASVLLQFAKTMMELGDGLREMLSNKP